MDIEVDSRRECIYVFVCVCMRERKRQRETGKALQHLAYDQVTQFTRVTFFSQKRKEK